MVIKEDFYVMSDGVRLYTRAVLPETDKKFPIVFIRTPYEPARNGIPCPVENYSNDSFIKNGYAILLQHVRGTGDSEGECRPYHERQDGLDTLELIRRQPFYNGEIYVFGMSYLATVHLCYLNTRPHDIKAAALSIQRDEMFTWRHHNGMCRSYCSLSWYLDMIKRAHPPVMDSDKALYRPFENIIERIIGHPLPDYTDMLLNDTYNDFWENQENSHAVDNLTIPVLLSEGWYDFYVDGMFSMWERLPEDTKKKSVFVVGPWGHATVVNNPEYPIEDGNPPSDYVVKFFNSVRDGTKYECFEYGRVNYYSVGGGFWTTDTGSTEGLKLYFNADGTLSERSYSEGEKSYEYDPDKPFNYYKYYNIFVAPEVNSREDVVSFISEPSERDADFYGRIRWYMRVRTDCEDTAFFMRVYFVENGVSYNLTEEITSLAYIDKDYTPCNECEISIDTPPIAFTLKKGCRIRVDISSHSNLYVPHSNTREHWAKAIETKIAQNTLICDKSAYILLPSKR